MRERLTFLFTDIEGSTRLWEEHPEAMYPLLEQHDALVRSAIETGGGRVFRTVGDAFYAAFADPSAAVSSALSIHAALEAADWSPVERVRVRIALHTGETDPRDGDYYGPELNRVARLLAAGHGGQILVSGVTAAEGLSLPPGASLRDHGRHRLKDLREAMQVFEVVITDADSGYPPLRTLDRTRNNLPVQTTSFIGRRAEIQAVKDALKSHRLVTLHASGGAGKTRLALQVAAESSEEFPDGVWFVDLAPLTEDVQVLRQVADAMGLRDLPGQSVEERLFEEVAPSRTLIVLDNCEHLTAASALAARRLLEAGPELRVMATSRERLGLTAEASFPVPPLAVDADPDADGVRLFVERSPRPTTDVPTVARIARRLDGIPLAIELAAARTRHLTLAEVESALDDRFRLLTGGDRTALPRQQTLRALIDWSYELLGEEERQAFLDLACFAGGFDLESAAAVLGRPRFEATDLVASLADKSLVTVDALDAETARYGMLESLRAFALEHQPELPARPRHAQFFLERAERLDRELSGDHQAEALEAFDRDHDNFRQALLTTQGTAMEVALTARLGWYWELHGHWAEGRAALARALASGEGSNADRARSLLRAGILARREGDFVGAVEPLERALDLFRESGDRVGVADALNGLGGASWARGDFTAAEGFYRQVLELRRDTGDRFGEGASLYNLGVLATERGELDTARSLCEQSLVIAREIHDEIGVGMALNILGNIESEAGDPAGSLAHYEEAAELARRLGDEQGLASCLSNTGIALSFLGRQDEAFDRHWQALELFRKLGDQRSRAATITGFVTEWYTLRDACEALELMQEALAATRDTEDRRGLTYVLDCVGWAARESGDVRAAWRFRSAAQAVREDIGHPVPQRDRANHEAFMADLARMLGDDRPGPEPLEATVTAAEDWLREAVASRRNEEPTAK